MNNNLGTSTFWRPCDENGICHCDWRLTIYYCEEEPAMKYIYIVNAVLSGFVGFVACILLYHRVVNLKQTCFDCRTGFPRPKPIESMGVFGIIFNFLRMIHAIIIVTDAAPNVAFRQFFFEFPWQFGIGALACYLFGVAHTLADSSKVIYDAWIHAPRIVDAMCVLVITLPFISNNIVSIAGGVSALHGNNYLAEQYTSALYYLWTFYTGFLAVLIVYGGLRLLRLLNHHLLQKNDGRVDIRKIKLGALKVKIMIATGFTCLTVFALILVLYGVLRDSITAHTGYNVGIGAIWTYDGVLATAFIEFSVILNPRLTATLGGSGFSVNSSQNRSHGVTSPNVSSKRYTSFATTMTGTTAVELKSGIKSVTSSYADKHASMDREPASPSPLSQTQIEKDQLYYNAMTNVVRAPPRSIISPTLAFLDEKPQREKHSHPYPSMQNPDLLALASEYSTSSSAIPLMLQNSKSQNRM